MGELLNPHPTLLHQEKSQKNVKKLAQTNKTPYFCSPFNEAGANK